MKRRRRVRNIFLIYQRERAKKVGQEMREKRGQKIRILKHILDIFDDRGFSHNADPPARGESSEERRE
jgi:hypothetical protein